MKFKGIVLLVVMLLVLPFIPLEANESPSLTDLIWEESPHHQITDTEYTLTYAYNQFTFIHQTPADYTQRNIGFQIKTTNLPTYLTLQVILSDITGKIRLYTLYNQAAKLIGATDYTNQIISWPSYYYQTTGFNPEQITKIQFKTISDTSPWTLNIRDIRTYPEIKLYPMGAVIICADGAPYSGIPEVWLPELDRYDYKMCLATATTTNPNWPLIEQMASEGHDIGVYARMFSLTDPTQLLPVEQFQVNTYGEKTIIEQHTGKQVNFLQANRHLTDERTDALLEGFPMVKGSSFTSSSSVAQPFYDYYGGTTTTENDLAGISKAAELGTIYILFDHGYPTTLSYAKTAEQVHQIIERIHSSGVKVVTWTQLCGDLLAYYNQPLPHPPTYFTVEMNGDGYNILENGVIVQHFDTKDQALEYISLRFEEWEIIIVS